MLKQTLLVGIVTCLMLAGSAQAAWTEDFEGFSDGDRLCKDGSGWHVPAQDHATYTPLYVAAGEGYGPSKGAYDDGSAKEGGAAFRSTGLCPLVDNNVTFRLKLDDASAGMYVWLSSVAEFGYHPYIKVYFNTSGFKWKADGVGTCAYSGAPSYDTWYDLKIETSPNGADQDLTVWYKLSSSGTWLENGTTSTTSDVGSGDFAPNYVCLLQWDGSTVDDIVVTPEPATMIVLGLGGLLALLRRRS